jgi:hypothetical protein
MRGDLEPLSFLDLDDAVVARELARDTVAGTSEVAP